MRPECYNMTNLHHNPMTERPEGLMGTEKTCQEWCGKVRSECVNALLRRSPIYEKKQLMIKADIDSGMSNEDIISKHTVGLQEYDKRAIASYIKGLTYTYGNKD